MKHLPSIILYLNRKYDVCSCLSQSEDLNPGVLFVKTEFMRVYERACHEDLRYLLVNLYQTIPKVWLWKMLVWQVLSGNVYWCSLFQHVARGSRIFSKMVIVTEIIHLYSMGGLTCYWRIRSNEWCIVNYVR